MGVRVFFPWLIFTRLPYFLGDLSLMELNQRIKDLRLDFLVEKMLWAYCLRGEEEKPGRMPGWNGLVWNESFQDTEL
jgi:hypothetical protein